MTKIESYRKQATEVNNILFENLNEKHHAANLMMIQTDLLIDILEQLYDIERRIVEGGL